MITEDYVSFETAKLLKEKGFNAWCYKSYGTAVYHKGIPISFDEECELKNAGLEDEIEYVEGGHLYDFGCNNRDGDVYVYAAPTLQRAMKWLRKEHNLFIEPYFTVFGFRSSVTDTNTGNTVYTQADEDNYYASPEVSCEYALIYCLENLVKDSNSI